MIRICAKIFFLLLLCMQTAGLTAQNFSERERSYVSTPTPGLFKDGNTFYICPEDLMWEGFCFPLPGCKLISDYGRGGGNHSGIDIKTVPNDTVRSAFNGVVRMSKTFSGYGKVVVVRHSFGMETVYSHNSKNLVESGDSVKAGQPIALEGRTGRATTEHVHFETRVNGVAFNPNLLFDVANHTLHANCLEVKKTGNGVSVKAKKNN